MRRSRPSRSIAIVFAALLAVGAVGCSDDGDDSSAATTPAPADDASAGNGSNGAAAPAEDAAANESGSSENPTTFGYRVDGEPGTTVLVETEAETEVEEPQELSQTWTINDEPRWMLFSNWVVGGEMTLELTEGDTATVEVIRGHAVDPENPMAGIEVVEVLETVEVTSGSPVTVTFP